LAAVFLAAGFLAAVFLVVDLGTDTFLLATGAAGGDDG
jgi:hypothetical protein